MTLTHIEKRWMLQGMVDEIVGPYKHVQVFDDTNVEGGFYVTTRDREGITEQECDSIAYLAKGLGLELHQGADTLTRFSIWFKPTYRGMGDDVAGKPRIR